MDILERKISETFLVENCLYTGSGTSALYLVYKFLKLNGKNKILIPSMTCPQVASAAKKVDLDIIFADCNLDDYTLDYEQLVKLYESTKFEILVLVHIYGYICDRKIIDFCKKNNIIIIEDCAQSYKVNEHCDFSILSFGHTKFLQNSNWGGAILSSSNDLKDIAELEKTLPVFDNFVEKFNSYREKYYSLDYKSKSFYKDLSLLLIDNTLFFKARNNEGLIKKLEELDSICLARKRKMELYKNLLVHKDIKHPKYSCDSIAWRYTFYYTNDRDKLLEKLRQNNIDCSSWYIPSHKIFSNQSLKNSEFLESRIINLWLDESISEKQIENNINFILEILA